MINNSHAESIGELNKLISELEETYKNFNLITILSISSGYLIYYDFNKFQKSSNTVNTEKEVKR